MVWTVYEMATAGPGRYENAGHMGEPDVLQLPGVLRMPGVLTMPCVSAKPSALSVLHFLSFVFLPFLVLNVSFISFACRSFHVVGWATSPCRFCASYTTTPSDRSVLEVVEYVFYAVPALVVYVIPAVACVIREHDDGACETCSPVIGFESVCIFNDVAHDVLRPSHLRAVPLR